MAKMSDPRELFVHELGDLLYAENVLVKALPKLAQEATDAELRQGFESLTWRRRDSMSPTWSRCSRRSARRPRPKNALESRASRLSTTSS